MKKQLLLLIGLFCLFFSYAQKSNKDDFTYKRINVIDQKNETLQLNGAENTSSNKSISTKSFNGSGVGETTGELSVSLTGGANYKIPIAVPPGINGVEPEIALTYNSQSGNGLAGYGWNLAGISVISRVASTKFHDNSIDPVDFDDSDRFSLDGQRLLLKSGTYGKNGAVYQTENYSNLKIISYGTSPYGTNYGPAYFIIYYPDGSFAHFGNSTDSRTQVNYAITYWQNPQGVRISYTYTKENNSLRINKVKYGSRTTATPKNEIQFTYTSRERPEQAFVNGVTFTRNKMLYAIEVLSGGIGYRNYQLTYGTDTPLNYERLTSIQEKSGDNTLSHSAIQFNYTNSSSTITANNITTNLGLVNIEQRNAETVSLDLTGNGKMDFLVYPKSPKNKFWVFKNIQNSSTNYPYEVNTGTFEEIFPMNWLTHNNKILSGQGIGIIQNTANNQVKFKVYANGTSNPIYYQYEKLWDAPTYTTEFSCSFPGSTLRIPQKYISGDFNGDGLSDAIAVGKSYSYTECSGTDGDDGWPTPFEKRSSNTKKINKQTEIKKSNASDDTAKNNLIGGGNCECNTYNYTSSQVHFINLDRRISSGFSNVAGFLSGGLKADDKLLTADVNGDGKTDILHIQEGKIRVYTLNNANVLQLLWQTTNSNIKLNHPILLGDFNGDGKTDFLTPKQNQSTIFYQFMSTGNSFHFNSIYEPFKYQQTNWNGSNGVLSGHNLIPLDINGDGRTDIIEYNTTTYNSHSNGTQEIKVYNNTGPNHYDSSSVPIPRFTLGGSTTKTGNLKHFPIPIFLTSDKPNKSLDFASISNQWVTSFSFNHDHREDVLLRSIENNGVTYTINYNNLDSNEIGLDYMPVYQPTSSETYPNVDIKVAPGTKMVTSLLRSASGTPTLKQIYSYYGAAYNIEGLGFKGFKGIAKSNWHTSNSDRIFNVSKYNIQLRGVLSEEDSRPYSFSFSYTPSDYISKTTYTNASLLATNKVFKVWQTASVTQNTLEGTTINQSYLYDSYNNPTRITTNYNNHGTSVVDITYANNTSTSNYYIGRPTKEEETTTIGGNTFSTEKQFVYSGYLLMQKKTKGHNTSFDIEDYTYDVYGNITRKITTPYNSTSREVRFEYDNSGRFLTKSYDVENLVTSYTYNTSRGILTKETNPFGQETTYFYDSWDRLTKVTDYLGKSLNTGYSETNFHYTVTETGDDGSGKITVFDPLKRIITEKEKNVLGQWVSKSYQYDKFDRIWKESQPYTGSSGTQWTTNEYDFYGRVKKITSHTGRVANFTYSNLSVTANDGTKSVTTTKNAMGNIVSTTDPGGTINYTYFGNGAMKTANYNGVIISNEQDGWGRKTKTTDPSAGIYSYEYNGYGEITKETTPKGVTDYTYSSIGKLLEEKIVGDHTNMTTQYSYHPTNKMVSAISLINADGNNSTYSYTYDNQQRLTYTSETNSYAQFTKRLTYDAYGRVATEENYARLLANGKSTIKKVKNEYQYGSLKSIRDNATQELLWNVSTINSRNQVTATTMGNNLRTKLSYNNNGYLTEIKSEKSVSTTPVELMKLTFDFNDQRGTLTQRTNSLFSWTENFTYDNLDRLVSFNDNNGAKNHTYDLQGRITENNKLGSYNYSSKSYRLDGISLNSAGFSHYTQNWPTQNITYNAFKKPVEIDHPGKEKVSFQYNAFLGRANMFYGGTQTDKLQRRYHKHYSSNGRMEILYDKTKGKTVFINYIGGDAYSAPAIWYSKQESTKTSNFYYYLHRDYLGSILMITDKDGIIKEKRHFDAWGNIVKLTNGSNVNLSKFEIIDRGYTGHEHLHGVQLIHMNGRLYDPGTRRFLAPDNYIQDPYNTQNYNRYGYAFNNPLMYVDYNGEEFFSFIIAATITLLKLAGAAAALYLGINTVVQLIENHSAGSTSSSAQNPITNTNSQQSVVGLSSPPIEGGGYRLNNPYGISQFNMLHSTASSEIAYNASGPNDWIANGSNLFQQTERPPKIDFSKKGINLLNQFIDWYHYTNETRHTRQNIFADDIIDWNTVPKMHTANTGSLSANVFKGSYSDYGGIAYLSVVREYKGIRGDGLIVRHAEINQTGLDRAGNPIFLYRLVTQDGGAVISMRIHGNDLERRIVAAVMSGGFFQIKEKKD